MGIKILLHGNYQADAEINGKVIKTDQSKRSGGDESAPEPFEYFLSSIGTCAGAYIIGFCKTRDIPYENIEIDQKIQYDTSRPRIGKVVLDIKLPADFPVKYKDAVIRAADQCSVKKYIYDPFEIETIATKPV